MERSKMPHDVFISYSSKDIFIANAVCAILEERNICCWIAHRDAISGNKYAEQIIDAIDNSQSFVLIHSSDANDSDDVLTEVSHASNELEIIPFSIEKVPYSKNLDYYIGNNHKEIAYDGNCEDKIELLVQRIYEEIGKKNEKKCKSKRPLVPARHENIDKDPCRLLRPSEFCPSCGRAYLKDDPLCECEPIVINGDESITCPRCKSKVPGKYKFCGECGYEFNNNGKTGLIDFIKDKRVIGAVIVLLLVVFAFYVSTILPNEIKISSPSDGNIVSVTTTVTGYAKNLDADDKVYVLIQPQPSGNESSYSWWVLEPNVNSDGSWEANVQFGLPNKDSGREFKVCAIITKENLQIGEIGINLPKYDNKYNITVTRQ